VEFAKYVCSSFKQVYFEEAPIVFTKLIVFRSARAATTFRSNSYGTVLITWTMLTGNCTISSSVVMVGPIVATIPTLPQQLCGLSGSANVGAYLLGDATSGNWTASFSTATFANSRSPFTLFSWSASGSMILLFTPDSVCNAPATLTFDILPSCPQVLSREETIGIGVGATFGGLILITTGVIAAIWIYRSWNRRLVNFRNKDVAMPNPEYYKF
jgi:hypothetical protein